MIKKIAKSLLIAFLLINLGLTIHAAYAARLSYLPVDDLHVIGGGTGLENFEYFKHPDAPVDYNTPGTGTLGSTAYFAIDVIKYLMSGIAIIMIVVLAIKLIFGGSTEETATKAKKGLAFAILGLIIIQLADVAVKQVFFGEGSRAGEVLEDKTRAQQYALQGVEQVRGIVGFIEVALGAIALLVIIVNGIKIMIGGGEEESRKKSIKNIGIAAVGLVLAALSEVIVRGFIFVQSKDADLNPDTIIDMPDPERGKQLIVMITNFVSGFVATIAFVVLLYAGYMYVAAGSEEATKEKVKKLITGAIIGIILALGAFAITNTLITFQEENEYQPETEIAE
ncbi:MAG: hypothetical protein WC604_04535 [Candidatus Gracilibacteria bacterium]